MLDTKTAATLFALASALVGGAAFAQTGVPSANTLVSDVYDQSVYDKGQNKIGKVDNLVVGQDGKIATAVVGVGGFLGVGEKDVQVPYSDIKWVSKDGKNWLELDRSKDQLKAAPAFDTKAMKK